MTDPKTALPTHTVAPRMWTSRRSTISIMGVELDLVVGTMRGNRAATYNLK
jgi:hypothetical protein